MAIDRRVTKRVVPLLAVALTLALGSGVVQAGTVASDAGALPPPKFGKSVDVMPVSGHVFIGSAPLTHARRIPVGSVVDASRGTVRVISAADHRTGTYAGEFSAGAFQVLQNASGGGVTELRLAGESFADCGKATAARGRPSPKIKGIKATVPGHLYGARLASAGAVGSFRTAGRFATAENDGAAVWDTVDACAQTSISDDAGNVNSAGQGDPTTKGLLPGQTWTERCSPTGPKPLPRSYCLTILGDGQYGFEAGLHAKTLDNNYDLCVTGPIGRTSCTTWVFSPPAANPLDPFFGGRDSQVSCDAHQKGDYSLSWRIHGIAIGPPLTYHARVQGVGNGPCSSQLGPSPEVPFYSPSTPLSANAKAVNRYSLPTGGWLEGIAVTDLVPTGTSGLQTLQGVVYADANGTPGALVGTTQKASFESTSTIGPVMIFFPSLHVAAGNYWFGVISGATSRVAIFYEDVSGSRDYNANSFSAGPSDPFGPFSNDNKLMAISIPYSVDTP